MGQHQPPALAWGSSPKSSETLSCHGMRVFSWVRAGPMARPKSWQELSSHSSAHGRSCEGYTLVLVFRGFRSKGSGKSGVDKCTNTVTGCETSSCSLLRVENSLFVFCSLLNHECIWVQRVQHSSPVEEAPVRHCCSRQGWLLRLKASSTTPAGAPLPSGGQSFQVL